MFDLTFMFDNSCYYVSHISISLGRLTNNLLSDIKDDHFEVIETLF